MNRPLISIIVPVYKVEKYIRECIDSVRNQSYHNWEMILVDDGSPDGCPQICDEYVDLDSRIKVIHKENGGVSKARNIGIENAKGEYIYFLDSDDFLPEDALKTLVETGEEFNWPEYIKGCHYVLMADNRKVITKFTPPQSLINQVYTSNRFMEGVILRHPLVWNGLIKREFLEKNNIEFKTDIINREDLIFHLDISNLFFFGVYTPKPTYTYRLAIPNSLSNSINKHIIFNDISIIKALINCKNKIQDSTIKNYADKELIKTVNKFFRNILRLKRYDRNFLLRRYHLEINQTKIPRNDLNVFSKLDQISPFCYSIFADIIGVIMPKKYKINS